MSWSVNARGAEASPAAGEDVCGWCFLRTLEESGSGCDGGGGGGSISTWMLVLLTLAVEVQGPNTLLGGPL